MMQVDLFLIALGLSMDAFAVAMCQGLPMKRFDLRQALRVAFFFGLFQAVMPLLGWVIGSRVGVFLDAYDHWIAFVLLLLIGGKMIFSFFRGSRCAVSDSNRCSYKELFVLSLATSLDAWVIGMTFVFLDVRLLPAVVLIGCTTAVLSLLGIWLGQRAGGRIGGFAELAGGVVLILIGLKILLTDLNIFV